MLIDSRRADVGRWRGFARDRVSQPECSTAPGDRSVSEELVGWDPVWPGPTRGS
jgi:hypothetical protein